MHGRAASWIFTMALAMCSAEPHDVTALRALYDAAGGPAWSSKTGWLSGAPCGSSSTSPWHGITCTEGNVTGLCAQARARVASHQLRRRWCTILVMRAHWCGVADAVLRAEGVCCCMWDVFCVRVGARVRTGPFTATHSPARCRLS